MSIQIIPIPNDGGTALTDSIGTPTGISVAIPIIDNSYNFNHTGIYKVSASSFSTRHNVAYYAFDGDANTFWQTDFSGNTVHQKNNKHPYTQNSYVKSKNGPSTYQGGGTISSVWATSVHSIGKIEGEWLEINIPLPIKLTSYTIKTPAAEINTFPQGFVIVGSNDGSVWHFIDEQVFTTDEIDNISITNTFNVVSMQSYSYFRLIITSLFENNTTVAISQWLLIGGPNMVNESFTTLSILEMNNPYNYKLSESITAINPEIELFNTTNSTIEPPIFRLSRTDIFFSVITISAIFFLVISKR